MIEVTEAEEVRTCEEYVFDYLADSATADKWLRKAIVARLKEKLLEVEQDEAEAAGPLAAAYAALQGPEQEAADLLAEITRNESERDKWQAIVETGDVAARVDARRWVEEYENELTVLREKHDFVTAQLLPLRDAHAQAKRVHDAADRRRQDLEDNAKDEYAYLVAGQDTAPYKMFRFGMGLEKALRNDAHPEHHAAVEHMLSLCASSGFRTEDYADRLPSEALQAKAFWDSVYENANPPGRAPSGAEVMAQVHAEMTDLALHAASEKTVTRIDDYRQPGPPKQAPDRDYMIVDRMPDTYRRIPGRG